MKISYISDLHLDFYTKDTILVNVVNHILKNDSSEVLIIAGDLSHYINEIVQFLMLAMKLNNYKKIFYVAGNHELYNVSTHQQEAFTETYDKYNKIKEEVNKLENVHFLDGDVVTFNNVKFGGTMFWYNDEYFNKIDAFPSYEYVWNQYTNDSRLIPGVKHPDEIYNVEVKKLKKVLDEEPDVVITHICPNTDYEFIYKPYRYEGSTSFYCTSVSDLVTTLPKYWVYGHMHTESKIEKDGCTYVRNPYGYPYEIKGFKLQHFSI